MMELSRIEERLSSIESRLAKLERHQERAPQAASSVREIDPFEDIPVSQPSSQARVAPPSEIESGNWLGIIAVICFVLAAGFIVKLSIDAGWLTPLRQISLAALLGLSLIGAGFALLKSDRDYASLLPGAGIIVLYLTTFAAYRYYSLVSFEVAVGLTSIVSGFCVLLYTKIQHDVYPITATLGAYLAPAVFGLHVEAIFSLYYFLICSIAFATISTWIQSRVLILIAAYLALIVTALIGVSLHQDILTAIVLALHFLIFSLGAYFYAWRNQAPLDKVEAWCFLPVLLIFYALEYYFLALIQPALAPWISLTFSGVLMGLYALAKRYVADSLESQSLIAAFTAIVWFHSIYLELLPMSVRPWLFVVIILIAAFSPLQSSAVMKSSFLIPSLALLAIVVIEYVTMLFHLLDGDGLSWVIVSFASLAVLWIALSKETTTGLISRDSYGYTLLGAAHLLAVLGLYRLTTPMGSLAVSASWLFYAVGVIAFAVIREDQDMAKSALIVLAFSAAKALLYDAASAPTVVRILCLLLTGAVLYGCEFFMRQTSSWSSNKKA